MSSIFAILALFFPMINISASDSQCSNCRYEEQLLKKMVRLEMSVETMKKDIEDSKHQLTTALDNLQKEKTIWKQTLRAKSDEISYMASAVRETNAKIEGEFKTLRRENEQWQSNFKASISDKCLSCLCKTESNCHPLRCVYGVNGEACGYFQIHFNYYKDCHKPRPLYSDCQGDIDCWKKCSIDYECASRCVRKYMDQHKNKNGCSSNCESFARLHNGGPNGCATYRRSKPNYDSTTNYWNMVQINGCSSHS